jgi:hypothetical protein
LRGYDDNQYDDNHDHHDHHAGDDYDGGTMRQCENTGGTMLLR